MKNNSEQQSNILSSLIGEMTEEKSAGLAFSAAAVLPYLLAFVFALVGACFGLFYEGVETADWYLYVGFLLSQAAFAIVAALFFRLSKTPVRLVIGSPRPFDFLLAIVLQFGLLSLAGVNSWFIIILKNWGLQVSEPQIPSLDGWGFAGVMLVVAVLPAILEEIVFRGILLRGLKGYPVWAAALLCGGLFSLFHQNPAQTLYQFFCGVAFALVAIRSGSILPTVVAHFCNNAFILCIEKFSLQTNMVPIMIASGVCLLLSVGYLLYVTVKAEKPAGEKANRKGFWLCAAFGVAICLVGWITGLFGV